MQSAFSASASKRPAAGSNPAVEETYDLKGMNMVTPDSITPPGESPWTINSRMHARDDGDERVANRTRKGSSFLSTPVGETLNVQNLTASNGDLDFSATKVIANPFTPNATGALSRMDHEIKRVAGTQGHIIVEIWTTSGGVPGTMLAQSSILSSSVTTAYQYLPTHFIDAPTLTSGVQYFAVYYIQDNGVGSYYINQTAVGSALELFSTNAGGSWSTLSVGVHFKSYLSTVGAIKGYHLRYPSTLANRIMIAQLGNIYSIDKGTGTPVSVDSGLTSAAPYTRFAQWDDKTIWVNGFDHMRWWDGVVASLDVKNVPSTNPRNVIVWKNRLFTMTNTTRVDFSELSDPETWPSVNFFYVPSPKSPDPMTGWVVFRDNLTIFTHETKHIIIGSDIANFTRKEAVGTKGAVSQEAMVVDHNYIYFMADDGQIYRYNGVSDQLISDKIQPELNGITNINQVRLSIHRNQLRVHYSKNPSPINNRMALLDIESMQWFLDTDHPVQGSTDLYLDQNQLVEFSAVIGRVMYGETQYSDLGRMIDWKYWTNYKTYGYRRRTGQSFGGASAKKRIKRFRPVIRIPNANFTMYVGKDMDFAGKPDMRPYTVSGGGAAWGGGVKWGDGTKWGKTKQIQNRSAMSGRGNHIQYRFERKGVETPVFLYGYVAQYKIGRQK
jgi:hypothetical protein